jgi:hypothetical protein
VCNLRNPQSDETRTHSPPGCVFNKSTSAWTMTSSPSLEQIIEGEPTAPVKTKIVCTLGPKVRRRPNTQLFSSRRLLPFTL